MSGSSRGGPGGPELAGLVESIRRRAVGRTTAAAGLWTGVVVAAVLAGAWLLAGPGGWRGPSALPLILDGLLVAALAVGWLLVRRWIRIRLDERAVARALDRAAGLDRGSVLGALEVGRETPPGVSGALARSAEAGVLEALPDRRRLVEATPGAAARRWTRRGAVALGVGAALLGGLATVAPERSASAWSGLLRPTAVLAGPTLPPLTVEPGSGEMDRGASLDVRVGAPGRRSVELRWQFRGDVRRTREARVVDGVARFDLGPLAAPVELRVEAPDGARAGPVRITPLDPLMATDLRVAFRYPPHTGGGVESFRRQVPPLEIPAGTRVEVEGRASRALGAAALTPAEGPADSVSAELTVDGRSFRGAWRPVRSGTYGWLLRDPEGRDAAETPPELELTVVPDSAPAVVILEPGRDTLLPLDRRQRLIIRARDDYGVSSIELEAYRATGFGDVDEPTVQRLRAGGARGVVARPLLDVSGWELLPGDEVRYRARAVDNGPAAQRAETREFVLRVPRRSEKARAVQERMQETTLAVDSLRERAGRAAREVRELERRGVERRSRTSASSPSEGSANPLGPDEEPGSEEATFGAREDLRRAAEERAELLERADSLRRALDELERSAREADADDPELRRDLEELRELMERVADTEARRRAGEMAEEAGQMQAGEVDDALEELAEGQEELRSELERALERFRRASAEQEFRATAQETRELAQEEEALAEALSSRDEARDEEAGDEQAGQEGEEAGAETPSGEPSTGEGEEGAEADGPPSGDASERQERMAERAGKLDRRMEKLEETLARLGEHDAREGVEEAREQAREAGRRMSEAARRQSQGQQAAAGREGRQAAGELREAADALDRARNRMARQMDQAVNDALQRAADEALALARRQSEIRDRLRGAGADRTAELRGEEADVLEGLRNLAGNVGGMAAMAPGSGQPVLDAVRDAATALGQTLEAMANPRGGGASPAALSEEAVGALNRVALAASSGAGQQSGGQSASSGSGSMRQQVESLARRQGNITDRTGAMAPRRLGRRPSSDQLREVAGRQEAVAEQLRELSRRQRAAARDEQLLGDMGGLSEDASEVAERLSDGRLDRETLERQERLFHRLLDAGRSLEKNEEARQRESETALEVERDPVEPLSTEALGGARFGLPTASVLQSLSPAQRALVVRYFERLNREPTEPPGGDDGGAP